jgi:hypothetical protein
MIFGRKSEKLTVELEQFELELATGRDGDRAGCRLRREWVCHAGNSPSNSSWPPFSGWKQGIAG